jgi:hypothetical protein
MQTLLKELISNEIVRFKMFNCKAYLLLKEANALKKMKK